MASNIVARIAEAVTTILIATACIFLLVNLAPGNPMLAQVQHSQISESRMQLLEERYGLTQPLAVRYFQWLNLLLHGSLGDSFSTKRAVSQEISDRLGSTVLLMSCALSLGLLLAVPAALIMARRPGTKLETMTRTMAGLLQAIPSFWLGLVLITVFYGLIHNPLTGTPLLPSGGIRSLQGGGGLQDVIVHLIMPVTTLALPWGASISRYLSASLSDELSKDYVHVAHAKGLPDRLVLRRHVFKNASLPLITVIAMDLPSLFGGALLVEVVFSWPGMGRLFEGAATNRDYPVLMGISLITCVMVVAFNLFADLLQLLIDPRLRVN